MWEICRGAVGGNCVGELCLGELYLGELCLGELCGRNCVGEAARRSCVSFMPCVSDPFTEVFNMLLCGMFQ